MKADEQIKAIILGHAIADAMGVPVEFMRRATLAKDPVTGYLGYGSHPVPPGTWSDDTSMTLAALDSLSYGLDYQDMMECFCAGRTALLTPPLVFVSTSVSLPTVP